MKWVALILLWANLAWGSVGTINANALWTDCILEVSRRDSASLMPALYLNPKETRALIAVFLKSETNKWSLGLADYIGSHESIIQVAGHFGGRPKEVIYGGELLIRNPRNEEGLGEIYQIGDASGFLFEALAGQPIAQLHGITYRNNPSAFLAIARIYMSQIFADDIRIIPHHEKPHLLDFSPEDMRHTFTGFLQGMVEMSRTKQPLGDVLTRYNRSITYTKMMEKIRWVIPHLKQQLYRPIAGYETLPEIIERWHNDQMDPTEWNLLTRMLSALEKDCKELSERVLIINFD